MNIQSIFLLIPCIAGFFWLFSYLLFASKGVVYRRFAQFLAVTSLFLLFAVLSAKDDAFMLLHFTLFKQVCALLLIPYFIKYIKSLDGERPSGVLYSVLSAAPYIQLVVGIESVFSIGYWNGVSILLDSYTFQGPMFPYLQDRSQMIFYAGYTYMFRAMLLLDFLMFSVYLMRCVISGKCRFSQVTGFFFKRKKAPVKPVQFFIALLLLLLVVSALVLDRSCVMDNLPLLITGCIILAVLISLLSFVGTAGTSDYQSIPGILKTVRFGMVEEEKDEDNEEASNSEKEFDNQFDTVESVLNVPDTDRQEALEKMRESIAEKLDRYLIGEQMFLKRDLTINSVADKLGVFKDELSDYISYKYDMSFQNYINMLRIGYAEKYLMSHDRATQNEIALECGFSGASSFNSAFSKKNGVTPKIWKDRQLALLKNQEA